MNFHHPGTSSTPKIQRNHRIKPNCLSQRSCQKNRFLLESDQLPETNNYHIYIFKYSMQQPKLSLHCQDTFYKSDNSSFSLLSVNLLGGALHAGGLDMTHVPELHVKLNPPRESWPDDRQGAWVSSFHTAFTSPIGAWIPSLGTLLQIYLYRTQTGAVNSYGLLKVCSA